MINLTMMVAAACLNGAWPAKCGATAPGACTNEPAALSSFRPGETKVGGEIGRRLDLSMEKILHHMDIEGAFAKHFKTRKEKPDEPGGFAGYGMLLDALVKGAARGTASWRRPRRTSRRRSSSAVASSSSA